MTTEATRANRDHERLSWLLETWTEGLNNAFSAMGLPVLTLEELGDQSELTDPEPLWCGQIFNVLNQPCVWIGAGKSAWQQLGSYIQRQAGIEEADEAVVLDTYREILAQSLAALATALSTRLGREVACTETTTEPPPSGHARIVRLETGDGSAAIVCLACSPGLLQLLDEEQHPDVSDGQTAEPGDLAVAFESVLDLDMPISVTLGFARIDLQRTLNLTEGAVIRLGQAPSDLMELSINGRCVAKGELVAARGQYAIKIHEVSGGERLAQVQSIGGPEQRSLPSSR